MLHKIRLIGYRGKYAFQSYPTRIIRFWKTIWLPGDSLHMKVLKLVFLFGDVLLIPEIYESLMEFFKWKTRALTEEEQRTGASVYRDLLPWYMIRIDERASLGPKKYRFAYVSFFTINTFGSLQAHIYIHELMHIYQYLRFGSAYIPMALKAQRSVEKYNYGGLESLELLLREEKSIWHLNFEQQADVMSDYYLLRKGEKTKWGSAKIQDLETYERFVFNLYEIDSKNC